MTRSYDALVLAGGAARRLGGTDKPALAVGGLMLLDRVLAACADARTTVVVGPRRPTARPVRWTREEPAGGGPLPALAAGLAALDAAHAAPGRPGTQGQHGTLVPHAAPGLDNTGLDGGTGLDSPVLDGTVHDGGIVLVLAADLPFLTAATTGALADALTGDREGVLLTDAGGRDQPLAAAYRSEPLRRELALLRAEHGHLTGLPLRLLTGELALHRIADPTGDASFDCDTWEDVAVARARLDGGTPE
ncbi:molybdenum cofactor guanylyltransferase [Streptomyces sp. NPDC020917]|uniref:molybdenum cofactor guanylyltransferase n=1 Tax=Streptomyces sp. NPDC020917 TaxID=3365102 RepID=UPI00378E4A6C